MSVINISAILISLAALFSFLNYRFFRLPSAIGIMLISLGMSLAIVFLDTLGFSLREPVREFIERIDLDETLLHGMLSFLLFAGALHVNLGDLARQKWIIGMLATFGIVLSTLIIGPLVWLLSNGLGLNLAFIHCLLFGALISPTDPIAVLGILKKVGAPKSLETKITGESLFNDGIGVVVFLVLLKISSGDEPVTVGLVALLFIEEALGGIVFGLIIGGVAYWMLRQVDNYQVEVLITLALVMGGYSLADALHTSGPIAIVVAGLLIGNHGRLLAMSERTVEHLDMFWELLDEILNAILFLIMGMEVLILMGVGEYALAGLLCIPIVLLARFVCVGIPVTFMRQFREFSENAVKILTWGGLRGGISIALALSLPASTERDIIFVITYSVVVFSVLVQGLTIGAVVQTDSEESSSRRVLDE
jgi:CPA1 family monovalent cation:H+ antiporter